MVQCQEVIERSLSGAQQLIDDVDLHLRKHDCYGKGFIKQCKISPDAYIQMALQLAYYRVIVLCHGLYICSNSLCGLIVALNSSKSSSWWPL